MKSVWTKICWPTCAGDKDQLLEIMPLYGIRWTRHYIGTKCHSWMKCNKNRSYTGKDKMSTFMLGIKTHDRMSHIWAGQHYGGSKFLLAASAFIFTSKCSFFGFMFNPSTSTKNVAEIVFRSSWLETSSGSKCHVIGLWVAGSSTHRTTCILYLYAHLWVYKQLYKQLISEVPGIYI
jgi:hypothetical protein